MKKIAAALLGLFALVGSAVAQPGPGPAPNPWVVNGAQVYLSGQQCVVMPRTVTGGCKGNNTLNAAGLYVNGSAVLTVATGASITVNVSTITGGTSGRVLYDNAGTVGEYTAAQLTAQINAATSSLSGALPAFPGTTTTYFRGDGTYQTTNCAALTNAGVFCSGTSAASLTGTLNAAQMPALTGDATSSVGTVATTVAKINGATLGTTTATAGNILVGSGTQWASVAVSGDAALSSAGALTVSKIGGVSISLGGSFTTTGAASLPAIAQGDLWYGSAAGTISALAKSATASRYLSNSGTSNNPAWAQVDLTNGVTGQIPLANGGTNANLTASNGGIIYSTASAFAVLAGTVTANQCLLSGSNAAPSWGSCAGGAAVSSVTAADSTLTISPTTGAVLAGINLATANTWTGNITISAANLTMSGNISAAAWTTNGVKQKWTVGTVTDTTSSGTVATAYTSVEGGDTVAASSSTTYTNYYSRYVKDPVAGSNVTMTNKWAVGGDSARFGTSNQLTISTAGALTVPGTTNHTGAFQINGNTMTFPAAAATIPRVVASGAKALATGAISSGACTTAQTDTATGTLTTDAVIATFSADPTGTTGYAPSTSGMLSILAYPTADTVNYKVCNNTGASITPGAVTVNWRVVR